MHKNILSTITYVVKTRFCTSSKEFQITEFNSDNGLKNRLDAFSFLKITSKLFQMKVCYKLKAISFNQKQFIE
ncbi:hypothetical protein OBK17_01165 [Empedobacter falsenii]|uniref:hypothetical protein n=1 Tax=Empedobacter TaxID=59734 RepID=UPI0025B8D695|nr:hypothetical protein [Empedobacter sp. UBA3239]